MLDTGSDETVFEEWIAQVIGVDLTQAIHRDIGLVGRLHPVRIKYVSLKLCITDGSQEVYEWPTMVAFTSTKLRFPLLGYAGFLQFFHTEFHGGDQTVGLTPHSKFPGSVRSPGKP